MTREDDGCAEVMAIATVADEVVRDRGGERRKKAALVRCREKQVHVECIWSGSLSPKIVAWECAAQLARLYSAKAKQRETAHRNTHPDGALPRLCAKPLEGRDARSDRVGALRSRPS